MSHSRRDIFTCDRCHKTQNMPAGEQPPGWYRVMTSSPVLANPLEADRSVDRMLCHECFTNLDRWLRNDGRRGTWEITFVSDEQQATEQAS